MNALAAQAVAPATEAFCRTSSSGRRLACLVVFRRPADLRGRPSSASRTSTSWVSATTAPSTSSGLGNYRQLVHDPAFWQALRKHRALHRDRRPDARHRVAGDRHRAQPQARSRFFPRACASSTSSRRSPRSSRSRLIWGYLYNSQFRSLQLPACPRSASGPCCSGCPIRQSRSCRSRSLRSGAARALDIIIFLAALQSIPQGSTTRAAVRSTARASDGRLFDVTIPLLKFAIFFVTVTTLISWMQFFDEPYVLTKRRAGQLDHVDSRSYIYQQGLPATTSSGFRLGPRRSSSSRSSRSSRDSSCAHERGELSVG